VEEGRRVVCVYCFDPRQFGKTPFGFEKTGRYRAKFLVGAVAELRDRLRAIGGELVVRRGRPEEAVVEVCRRAGARDVFYHREVSYEEQQVEDALDEACRAADVGVKRFWANTLYHCEDLPFDLADMPDVYTEFREAVQRDGVIRAPLPPPDGLPPPPKAVDAGAVPTLGDLGLSEPDAAAHGLHAFVGGEGEALRRLAAYIGETRAVPAGRSAAVHLGADFSCKISPWLALGCVSPRRIHADLSERSAKAGQTSTYFELIWRDFFRFITQKYALSRITDGKAGKGRGGGRVAAAAVARRPSGALAPAL
jgi:deoxyribodipyrimidine photo-lyase